MILYSANVETLINVFFDRSSLSSPQRLSVTIGINWTSAYRRLTRKQTCPRTRHVAIGASLIGDVLACSTWESRSDTRFMRPRLHAGKDNIATRNHGRFRRHWSTRVRVSFGPDRRTRNLLPRCKSHSFAFIMQQPATRSIQVRIEWNCGRASVGRRSCALFHAITY